MKDKVFHIHVYNDEVSLLQGFSDLFLLDKATGKEIHYTPEGKIYKYRVVGDIQRPEDALDKNALDPGYWDLIIDTVGSVAAVWEQNCKFFSDRRIRLFRLGFRGFLLVG